MNFTSVSVAAALVCSSLITGCVNTIQNYFAPVTETSNTTYAVTVGMESSKFAGACPGAQIDCRRMTNLLSNYTTNVVSFVSEQAIKKDIVAAIKEGLSKAELFVFYYSGHGGSQKLNTTGAEEVDGQDEFLCFYDTYMLDNEIWNLVKDAKCRIVLIFDCCHSCTLYRASIPTTLKHRIPLGDSYSDPESVSMSVCCTVYRATRPMTLKRFIPLGASYNEPGSIRMTVWSGCPDNAFSYGSSAGGFMTNSLLKNLGKFSNGCTYDQLWSLMEEDKQLAEKEDIQRTTIGNFDNSIEFFK